MRKYVILLCSLWMVACTKVKTDKNLPVLNTLKSSNSSIRLITLMGPDKVTAVIGGLNYNLTPNNAPGTSAQNCQPGVVTSAFQPTAVSIPEKVLDQAGNAHLRMAVGQPVFTGSSFTYFLTYSDTVFPDNPNNPTDYYITPSTRTFAEVNYTITAVTRSATPPVDPRNIKIRVVNMAAQTDTFQRTGPLTLTYADGKPVSTLTSNVPSGVASAYVEIPYNTYRFRLFNQVGVEVPESTPVNYNSLAEDWPGTSYHNYQPGGVYTLFINSNYVFIVGGCAGVNVTGNCFSVIPDVTPPVNTSFALVQYVNTIPGISYSLKIDNSTIGSVTPFRGVSGYQTMSLGNYSMRLTDQDGQTVVQQNITINPNDNLTIWSYTKGGKPALSITASDLSTPNGLTVRFMNFSTDVPYITYTYNGQVLPVTDPVTQNTWFPDINDTTSAAGASENLAIGVPATHLPYTGLYGNWPLQVNRSDAGPPPFVPGIPLFSVRPLQQSDFTINNALYAPGNPAITKGELGVYTVALTGTVDTTLRENGAIDTLLIVKHFK